MKIIGAVAVFLMAIGCNTKPKQDIYEISLESLDTSSLTDRQKLIKNLPLLIKEAPPDSIRSRQLRVAKELAQLHKWAEYKDITDSFLKTAIANKNLLETAKGHLYTAYYYMNASINDSAFYHYHKAHKFYTQLDHPDVAYAKLNIAVLYYYVSDFSAAEKYFFDTVLLARLSKSPILEGNALTGIALINFELKEPEKALQYCTQALSVYEKESFPSIYNATIYMQFFDIYFEKKELRKAGDFLHMASQIIANEKAKYPELYARVLDQEGLLNMELGKQNKAKNCFLLSRKIRQDNGVLGGANLNNLFLAQVYHNLQLKAIAMNYAREALELSKQYKSKGDIVRCLEFYIQNFEAEPHYFLTYKLTRDSLQLAERRARNKFARIAFETDEISQQKDQAVQDKKVVIGVSSVAMLFSVLLLVIIRQRARQKEMLFVQEQQIANQSIYQLMHDQQAKINEGRQIEKKRIARELHDGVMNRLASTRLNLFILTKKKDEETVNKCLPFIAEIQGIEKEIRQVAHDLDNDLFSGNVTFTTILEELFRHQNTVGHATIHHEITGDINWNAVDSTLKINLYRIIQESIQNVEKHSEAKNLYINIIRDGSQIKMVIHDDGKGFDAKRVKAGIGLKNIAARTRISGGTIDIKSGRNQGTLLTVIMPITDVI